MVGLDDFLDEGMPDDVLFVEPADGDLLERREDLEGVKDARIPGWGRSIWVMSAVTTTLESNPARVRNIFICGRVVFWASSRMTNAAFKVRPRM